MYLGLSQQPQSQVSRLPLSPSRGGGFLRSYMMGERPKIKFNQLTPASQKGILEALEFIYVCNGAADPKLEAQKKVVKKPRSAKEWRYYRYKQMVEANKIRVENGKPEFYDLFSKS